ERMIDPAELAARLADLDVEVEALEVTVEEVAIAAWPGGRRPSGTVVARGRDEAGRGEHVAFTLEEQRRFAADAPAMLRAWRGRVGDLVERGAPPYARAALEGALIDLALRQARRSLADLAATETGALDYVISFDACDDPARRAGAIAARNAGARFK